MAAQIDKVPDFGERTDLIDKSRKISHQNCPSLSLSTSLSIYQSVRRRQERVVDARFPPTFKLSAGFARGQEARRRRRRRRRRQRHRLHLRRCNSAASRMLPGVVDVKKAGDGIFSITPHQFKYCVLTILSTY